MERIIKEVMLFDLKTHKIEHATEIKANILSFPFELSKITLHEAKTHKIPAIPSILGCAVNPCHRPPRSLDIAICGQIKTESTESIETKLVTEKRICGKIPQFFFISIEAAIATKRVPTK